MNNWQLLAAIGLPIIFNGLMFTLLNKRIDDLRNELNQRFDDMRDLWRAELYRVEGIIDARLKHLEEGYGGHPGNSRGPEVDGW
jgi:hypothetical protein